MRFCKDFLLPDFTVASEVSFTFIVIHHTEAETAKDAVEAYLYHKVSAHYLIDDCGKIYSLVEDSNIAYHAGFSHWQGLEGLNKCSIGIELQSKNVNLPFSEIQIEQLILLLQHLTTKHNIAKNNIISHSDIAYFQESRMLNRKQDPSAVFPWNILANAGFGKYSKLAQSFFSLANLPEKAICFYQQSSPAILQAKHRLSRFGYLVNEINNQFDDEMLALNLVFCRHFNSILFAKYLDSHPIFKTWQESSALILADLTS